MEKQDEKNKEITVKRTVKDTKKQIMETDITDGKFGTDEGKILYFFMLSNLRSEHIATVGITKEQHYIAGRDKLNIVKTLPSG